MIISFLSKCFSLLQCEIITVSGNSLAVAMGLIFANILKFQLENTDLQYYSVTTGGDMDRVSI